MKFLTEKNRDSMLFPRPDDGAVVQISPPGLAWLPAEGASGYRVQIRDGGGSLVYEKTIGSDPVHLPDQVLEAGDYKWDVAALDENGNESARRGEISFSTGPRWLRMSRARPARTSRCREEPPCSTRSRPSKPSDRHM